MREIKKGTKVHYTSPHGEITNGIVKSITEGAAFVVYHCNGEWDKYFNYTAAHTYLNNIKFGWVDDEGKILKEYCDHHYIPSASKWQPINRRTCIYCNDTID